MTPDQLHTPIFITGVERSGSSIIANVIRIGGAFVGKCTSMEENIKIKGLVDTLYKRYGADIKGQYPLPDLSEIIIPTDWRDKIESSILSEGYSTDKPWMYKSSRLSQIWPIWNYAFPDAKWIIVRRRSGDVIESCIKTGFMDAFGDRTIQQMVGAENERDGWKWWIHEHEKRFVDMIQNGLNCKVIWPERILVGDFRQIYEMLEWLGLPWGEGIMHILETKLIKNQKT